MDAVKKQLPHAEVQTGNVTYYDPYFANPQNFNPYFYKHFRYLYQKEYRFVWKANSTDKLEYFDIELGPMNDIAEFLEVKPDLK